MCTVIWAVRALRIEQFDHEGHAHGTGSALTPCSGHTTRRGACPT